MENGSGVPLNCSRTTATQRAAADTGTATALCMWHFWSSSICNQSNYIFMAFINQSRKRHPRAGMCVCVYIHAHLRVLRAFVYSWVEQGTPGPRVHFPHTQLAGRHAAVRLLPTIPKHIRNDDKTTRPHTERLLRHTACRAQTQRQSQA